MWFCNSSGLWIMGLLFIASSWTISGLYYRLISGTTSESNDIHIVLTALGMMISSIIATAEFCASSCRHFTFLYLVVSFQFGILFPMISHNAEEMGLLKITFILHFIHILCSVIGIMCWFQCRSSYSQFQFREVNYYTPSA